MILPHRVSCIIANVAAEHGVSVPDLLGQSRLAHIAAARRHAMIECRRMEWGAWRAPPSYPEIGRWFNRDHTTVLHACRDMQTEEQGALAL